MPPEVAHGHALPPPTHALLKGRLRHGLWNHYFFSNLSTRLALPWTRLFLAFGWSPRTISLASFALACLAAGMVAFSPWAWWTAPLGGVLFLVSLLWDHCDGQVARATRTGTLQGGLLDTVLDRWIELLWVGAVAVGVLAGGHGRMGLPAWALVALTAWAVHAQLYVRWSNIQLDLYQLQRELRAAPRDAGGQNLVVDARPLPKGQPDLSRTLLPFACNRDTTFWMLLVVTLTPWWDIGLVLFAALHTVLGIRQNQKTFRELRRTEVRAVRALVDPDYHK